MTLPVSVCCHTTHYRLAACALANSTPTVQRIITEGLQCQMFSFHQFQLMFYPKSHVVHITLKPSGLLRMADETSRLACQIKMETSQAKSSASFRATFTSFNFTLTCFCGWLLSKRVAIISLAL